MRKLSMKKVGIPAREAEKASGSGGVIDDGCGARGPLRCRAAGEGLECARERALPGAPAGAARVTP